MERSETACRSVVIAFPRECGPPAPRVCASAGFSRGHTEPSGALAKHCRAEQRCNWGKHPQARGQPVRGSGPWSIGPLDDPLRAATERASAIITGAATADIVLLPVRNEGAGLFVGATTNSYARMCTDCELSFSE